MNPMGITLSLVRRFAGSEIVDRLGWRRPAERAMRRMVRDGFRAARAASKGIATMQRTLAPHRLERREAPELFDLTLTEEQKLIVESAQRFATERIAPHAHEADEREETSPEVLDALSELGLALYAIPEALGGVGTHRAPTTQMLIAEHLARGDMGIALAALAPISVATALSSWGSGAQQAKYLPTFVERRVPSAIALLEPQPLFDPHVLKTRARSDGTGYVLHGEKSLVPLAEKAELFLVAADLLGSGPRLFLVERDMPGVVVEKESAMGLRAAALGRVKLDGVRLSADALLGEISEGAVYRDVVDLARIAWCALAVGTGQAVLDYVIAYANDRKAFGEPISHRQAVAFLIADLAIELDAMRLLTWRAASRAEHGETFSREAYLAHVLCREKAPMIGSSGVQLLGGHGFVKDHPVERWYRHLRALGVMEGALLV